MLAGLSATLRQAVAEIERPKVLLSDERNEIAFGVPPIDRALQGGLAPGNLHEVTPETADDFGAAANFIFVLLARVAMTGRHTLWIQTDFAARKAGDIYGPGCDPAALSGRQFLVLKVPCALDALWAMEEALKSRAMAGVVLELPDDGSIADLSATRRLTLAAQESGGFGFLLRHRSSQLTSSAETRWKITAAPSLPDQFGGLGRPGLTLSLVKNRHGPTGRWTVAWNHHERTFAPLPLGMAQATIDRPGRAPFALAG